MNQALLIALVVLGLIQVQSLPNDNIVIGIYTQKYHYGDHNATIDERILTYLAPTYANIASMAGAKVVPIYSYSTKEQILIQLSKVSGVIFTGGQEYININNTWTLNAHVVLEYAKKENDEGRTFPVLGICQGLELMLYLTSDMRVDFLDSISNQNGVWNTVQFKSKDYYLIDGLSDTTLATLSNPDMTQQGGPLYFYHSNGTLLQTFKNDSDLNQFWDLIGTTSKGNQTFVSYLEGKRYPFYVTQFHPQRLIYNNQLSDQLVYSRIELVNAIAMNFFMKCKKSPHHYQKDMLTNEMVDNFPMYDSTRFPDYRVYLFEEVGPGSQRKQTSEGLSNIGDILGFILIFGLLGSIGYYLYLQRKNSANTFQSQALAGQIQRDQFDYQNDFRSRQQTPVR